jgi:hypothetical protein
MILAAHADWSIDPRKRWMALAHETAAGWRVRTPELVATVADLFWRLRAEAGGGPVALGLDLPIGVPRAYAALRPEPDFLRFFRVAAGWRDFFQVCKTLAEVKMDRPFYPARGIKGMTRAAHAAALGLPGAMGLSRLCDRATAERPAGAPVFWTLGANQSGKAAISAWRDLLAPALLAGAPVRLWPFEGRFRDLLAPDTAAVAETYPAEAQRHLGIRLRGSKRRQADRAAVAAQLRAAMRRLQARPDGELGTAIAEGFGADAAGEDRFDCLLGVLCVVNVLAGNRPDSVPNDPWIKRWEGWVLGQTAMPARLPEAMSPLNIVAHERDVPSTVEGPGS